ncbi:MAG: NAD(P)-dependent alcohol dehydrogenase [Candidatus Melainabacteria bacterium HGW-Melainabacteria-1]|nr:MAG: NAD(P)-dependent alcohol dehydrogenase [Candidatus Melainabacteria bacterium HGW-Melainabacteria-1]
MKAIEYTRYGSPEVLKAVDKIKPVPKPDEVLVKIFATTVTSGDCRMRAFNVPFGFRLLGRLAMGLRGPRKTVLGTELAGEVEAVGAAVTAFRVGDPVIGFTGAGFGAHAEYVCLPETGMLVKKPAGLSFEEAAAVPFGGLTALFYLRDLAKLQPGQKVLIYGASGGVGTAAVQLAKAFGAHVTGVCSTGNLELVRSLGADVVLDYTQKDFLRNGERYDLILETVGKYPVARCKAALIPTGRCLMVVAGLPEYVQMLWSAVFGGKRVLAGISAPKREDLVYLVGLIEAGRLKTVIDQRYALAEIAAAHRYADLGHKKGNVVISVASPAPSALLRAHRP